MTPAEIEHEKAYRYDEAISLGRTPERAQAEVDAWEKSLTSEKLKPSQLGVEP